MAKRKRLTLPAGDWTGPAPETKSFGLPPGLAAPGLAAPGLGAAGSAPPIAQVAGDAAAAAALAEVAGAFAEARAEGRLVQRLPLAAVEPGHLIRDRIAENEEEMDGLMASLAAHGQRSPIDVTEIAPGRFGLISGWRRLTALSRLHDRTGEARFATVLALVRRPETAAAAYVAMVEENEVRLALSYYERARIAARAVDAGVFPTEKAALQTLYASASRARRSKIGSFLTLYRRLDPVLRFPAAIGERLGLALAQMVDSRPAHLAALVTALTERPAPGFLDELVLLQEAVDASGLGDGLRRRSAPPPALPAILPGTGPAIHPGTPDVSRAKHPVPPAAAGPGRELRPGVFLQATGGGLRLSGPGVDAGFRAALEDWLAAR